MSKCNIQVTLNILTCLKGWETPRGCIREGCRGSAWPSKYSTRGYAGQKDTIGLYHWWGKTMILFELTKGPASYVSGWPWTRLKSNLVELEGKNIFSFSYSFLTVVYLWSWYNLWRLIIMTLTEKTHFCWNWHFLLILPVDVITKEWMHIISW